MDPVDVLTVAVHAAQLLRSGRDPEDGLSGAYDELGLQRPDDGEDPLAVRIARLVNTAEGKRPELITFLREQAGAIPLNRPTSGWAGAVEPAAIDAIEADTEAEQMVAYAEVEEGMAREMMGDFPAFSVAEKRVDEFFGGRTIIIRDGKQLTEEEAGGIQVGDALQRATEGLPTTVRGLIDYPLERPCLFPIVVGTEPWSIWDICCSFADQYLLIYEQPEKFGVQLHDITDLWIERLFYFSDKRLIYPHIGS